MQVSYGLFFGRLAGLWLASTLACWGALSGAGALFALALVVGLASLLLWRGRDSRATRLFDARWATRKDLDALRPPAGVQPDAILVGFAYGQPLSLASGLAGKKELGNALVVGPSRSGKGLSITCNLLHWRHSVLVTDIKGDLHAATAGYRSEILGSRVIVLNPSSGEASDRFDPFLELDTDEQVFGAASGIMDADADGDNAVFGLRATALLAAMIRFAKVQGRPVLPELSRLMHFDEGLKGACLELAKLGDRAVSKWVNTFLGKSPGQYDWDRADGDRFLQNSWQRLKVATQFLGTEGVMRMTSDSDFRARDLLTGSVSVYLVFRESELETTRPVFNLVVDAIFGAILRESDLNPDGDRKPVLALFDEAGSVPPTRLPRYASTVAGRGVSMLVYVQSLGQLESIWGRDGKQVLLDNTHTKVFLPGVDRASTEGGTSAYVAASCGRYLAEDRSMGKVETGHEVQSSVRVLPRDLLTADEFATLPPGRSVILTNHLPPILAHRLEPWRFARFARARTCAPPRVGPGTVQAGWVTVTGSTTVTQPDEDKHLDVAF